MILRRPGVRIVRRCAILLALSLGLPGRAESQLLSPRTVPVHQGQQFEIFPSVQAGMGGASIALDDTLLDPFRNPAAARRVRHPTFDLTRYGHDVSEDRGGGSTLPVTALAPLGRWTIGGQYARQRLNLPRLRWPEPAGISVNEYATAVVSRQLGAGTAIGASAYRANLTALDGMRLLYQGSDSIAQVGESIDVRAGALKELGTGRIAELVLLYHRYRMTHDVHFPEMDVWFDWSATEPTTLPERSEHHTDYAITWGTHAEYRQPLGARGWHVGGVATVNRIQHPKIPEYELRNFQRIARDPGRTTAFSAGVGVARVAGRFSFAADVLLEPMRSHSWANAARDTVGNGGLIRAGAHLVDNQFRFANRRIRIGVANGWGSERDSTATVGFQLGLDVYSINYELNQRDHLRATSRQIDEGWAEVTPSLGIRLIQRGLVVSYLFSFTCGRGCDILPAGDDVSVGEIPGTLAPPVSLFAFRGGTVTRHRFGVTITR